MGIGRSRLRSDPALQYVLDEPRFTRGRSKVEPTALREFVEPW